MTPDESRSDCGWWGETFLHMGTAVDTHLGVTSCKFASLGGSAQQPQSQHTRTHKVGT